MKKILITLFLFTSLGLFCQAPQLMNYQGVARDASGTIISNSNVGLKFEILQGSTVVYGEEQVALTSAAGIFTAAIGNGINQVGTFSSINWASGPFSIRVGFDETGGNSYTSVGTSQLLSVPYALYAEKAGNTQTVNITGPGVTGAYPNYTITAPGALAAGPGISISGGTITNTAPNPTLTPSGIASVNGANPSFTIDVPPPSLNYNTSTNVLTLTQGTAVTTATLTGTASSTISMFASGIASVTPSGPGSNFTVSVPSPSFTNVGPTTITGTYPNFVVNSPGPSTVVPTNLQINPPHSTTTLSAGNYSINIAPTNITGPGVIGSYPNYTVTSAPATSVNAGSNMVVNGTAPNYTVATPTWSLSMANSSTGALTNGLNSSLVSIPQPTLTISGTNSNVISAGSNSITIPTYTAGSGITIGGAAPSYTINATAPTLSLSGSTLSSGPLTNSVNLSSLSVWSNSVGVLYPTTITNSVAIGTATASAPLEVIGSSTSTIGRFANSTNTGGAVITADHVGGSSASTYYGVKANANAIGGTTYGLYGTAGGSGTAYGVYGSMNGAGGYGVYGIAPAGGNGVGVAGISNAGSTTGAFGVFGSSQNSFGGVFQNSGATITASLGGQTYSGLFAGGNVGINVTTPANRLHVIESLNSSAAVFGSHSGATTSANAHGISGTTSNLHASAAGVFGQNTGSGPGVYGMKTTASGPAGRFDITSTSNTADAIFAQTNGTGAALHAVNGPTVSGSSNVGVWIEGGHIKSTSTAAPTSFSVSVSGGFTTPGFAPTCSGTDVRGVISFSTSATGFSPTNFFDIQYNFQKPYGTSPTVILTPTCDMKGLDFMVVTASTTGFVVRIYRTSGASFPASLGATTFTFTYFIIE